MGNRVFARQIQENVSLKGSILSANFMLKMPDASGTLIFDNLVKKSMHRSDAHDMSYSIGNVIQNLVGQETLP